MGFDIITKQQSLLILGLGNEWLADDGVGIHVLRKLQSRLASEDIAWQELSIGGLQLLDYLIGYQRCILIDAVVTGVRPPGAIHRFVQTAGGASIRLSSSHHVDLSQVLALGKILNADIPDSVLVYGIEAADTTTFSERCTDIVAKSIPQLVDLICRELMDNRSVCENRTVLATESTARNGIDNREIINH